MPQISKFKQASPAHNFQPKQETSFAPMNLFDNTDQNDVTTDLPKIYFFPSLNENIYHVTENFRQVSE